MEENQERLVKECERIEEYSLWNATSHFTAAAWARFIHLVGGAMPIVFGGIGGWKVLSDPATSTPRQVLTAGALTLAAGITGSLMAYWDLAKVRLEHFTAASKYKTIENEARRAREIDAHDEDYDALKKRVMELTARYDELGESSAQSFDLAFWLARRKIRAGRFESDKVRTE